MAKRYVVRAGDTLARIAQRECSGTITWQQIAADNYIPDPNLIVIGQELVLNCDGQPAPAGREYIVQPGDTLIQIALRECRDSSLWKKIAQDNNLADPDRIVVGQHLVLNCPGQGGGVELPGDIPASNAEFTGDWQNSSGQMLEGIDVAAYQPNTDWHTVKEHGDKSFVIVKATEGYHWTNPFFASDWNSLRIKGFVRGAYHYFRALQDPMSQVDHFLNVAPTEVNDLPPVVDVESTFNTSATRDQWVDGLRTWLTLVEQHTHRRPMIYSRANMLDLLDPPADFRCYPLWVAHYTDAARPNMPALWEDNWVFWQYSEHGRVPGVNAEVDLNRFNGSYSDLLYFIDQTG